jgi:glucosyl-3-phosphoglycerate synthase
VELASVLDTASRHGLDALAQVDLGSRAHKHQANHDLAVMAAELLVVAARRHGGPHRLIPGQTLEQFDRSESELQQRSRAVPMDERPPVESVPGVGELRLARAT